MREPRVEARREVTQALVELPVAPFEVGHLNFQRLAAHWFVYHDARARRKRRRRDEAFCVPELPDIAAYMTALGERIVGQPLERISIVNPFVLRTQEPPGYGPAGPQRSRAAADRKTHRDRIRRRLLGSCCT